MKRSSSVFSPGPVVAVTATLCHSFEIELVGLTGPAPGPRRPASLLHCRKLSTPLIDVC
jgi:hypothetical protein